MTTPGEKARRVPDEELDFDENLIYYHNGKRFTGIAYEDNPGRGLSEVSYENGYQHGPARDWYPSGVLKGEWLFRYNVRDGFSREFREDGSVISEKMYEFGILIRSREFDSAGNVVGRFELSSDSPNFELLERYRAEWSSRSRDSSG